MSRRATQEEKKTFETAFGNISYDIKRKVTLCVQDSVQNRDSVFIMLEDQPDFKNIAGHYSIEQVDSMITALTYFRDRAIERRNDETETE